MPFQKLQDALFCLGELVCVLRSDNTCEPGRITAVHRTVRGPLYDVTVGAATIKVAVPEEEISSLATQQGSHFIFEGVRHESFDGLLASLSSATPRSHPPPHELTAEALEVRVRKLFHEFAGEDKVALDAREFWGLAASVAAELDMDPRRFGDLSVMFDRFDINGDGMLEEDECVMLAQSMLRHYISASTPLNTTKRFGMIDLEVKDLEDHYELLEKLGQGGEGAVYLAREKASDNERVVKCYDKGDAQAPLPEIKEEFKLLRTLDHPRIQRLYDIFEDRSYVYIISEPYYGGHLGNMIENAFEAGISVTSAYIAKVLYQVLQGVAHLHSRYITHCDLKESNVMITTDEDWDEPSAVVIDFGLAHNFMARGTSGGTPGYMPPEVWTRGLWTPKGDVHALGVVTFQLFSNGEKCFQGFGENAVREATLKQPPRLDRISRHWRRCEELPPLLEAMLQKELHARPTAKECMEHPFFLKRVRSQDSDAYAEEALPVEAVKMLSSLGRRNSLQRAVLTDIAATHNLAELRGLNATFDAMDVDHDGVLTADEVRNALQDTIEPERLEEVVSDLVGSEGQVAYTAFMGQLLAAKAADEHVLLWREFTQLDSEGTGYLDHERATRLLERPALAKLLAGRGPEELMALMDENGDGRIVFEEFRRVLGAAVE